MRLLEYVFQEEKLNEFISLSLKEVKLKLKSLGEQLGLNFDEQSLTTIPDLSNVKRWELFSRIRFEYVKPTCTLRTQYDNVRVPVLLSETEKEVGLKEYFLGGLLSQEKTIPLIEKIDAATEGNTVAHWMKKHYQEYHADKPISQSKFPALYILIHDFHHVLLDKSTSPEHELEVSAFESAMVYKTEMPLMLIEQLEIMTKTSGVTFMDTPELLRCWNLGLKSSEIFEDFDLASVLDQDIETVRKQLLNLP